MGLIAVVVVIVIVIVVVDGGGGGDVKKNVNVICLPTEHQGIHKNSFRNVCAVQDQIGI